MRQFIVSFTIVVVVSLLAGILQSVFAFSELFLLKFAGATVLAVLLLAWCRGEYLRAHEFGAANQITLLRCLLSLVLLALLGEANESGTLWCVIVLASVAACSDAVDGYLARKLSISSEFGARFDMESDAFLIAVLALLAWSWERAGAWVLLAGAARYLFVASGYLFTCMRGPLLPSLRRKVVCVVQIVSLIVCFAPFLNPAQSSLVAGLGVSLLLYSFVLDSVFLVRARAG